MPFGVDAGPAAEPDADAWPGAADADVDDDAVVAAGAMTACLLDSG